ncbi:ABC transporter permease [Streptomyces sp. NPDC004111]|uniref:ABC transporter permease n=1 Tax=Streptomyces sp. NPDC004111 TaxID=3364690 RepID=UPI0036CC768B
MLAYLIRRLGAVIVMLLIVILVTFGIFFLIPKWAGLDLASMYAGKQNDPAALQGIRDKLGLADPIMVQLWEFVRGLFVGRDYNSFGDSIHCPAPCFGYSFRTEAPVWQTLQDRLPVTLGLVAGAAILWLVMGVATGMVSALKRGTLWDRGSMAVALAGVSLPIYFTGMLSLVIFKYGLGWVGEYVPFADSPSAWFSGMILPWVTLAFLQAAMYARLTRATMMDVMGEDYVRTARAKGLTEQVVIGKHAMRSTMAPILTVFGMDIGALVGGAILTETTFSIPGLGSSVLRAISDRDLPIIIGVTLITSAAVVIANLVVDLMYAVIDPRVRLA